MSERTRAPFIQVESPLMREVERSRERASRVGREYRQFKNQQREDQEYELRKAEHSAAIQAAADRQRRTAEIKIQNERLKTDDADVDVEMDEETLEPRLTQRQTPEGLPKYKEGPVGEAFDDEGRKYVGRRNKYGAHEYKRDPSELRKESEKQGVERETKQKSGITSDLERLENTYKAAKAKVEASKLADVAKGKEDFDDDAPVKADARAAKEIADLEEWKTGETEKVRAGGWRKPDPDPASEEDETSEDKKKATEVTGPFQPGHAARELAGKAQKAIESVPTRTTELTPIDAHGTASPEMRASMRGVDDANQDSLIAEELTRDRLTKLKSASNDLADLEGVYEQTKDPETWAALTAKRAEVMGLQAETGLAQEGLQAENQKLVGAAKGMQALSEADVRKAKHAEIDEREKRLKDLAPILTSDAYQRAEAEGLLKGQTPEVKAQEFLGLAAKGHKWDDGGGTFGSNPLMNSVALAAKGGNELLRAVSPAMAESLDSRLPKADGKIARGFEQGLYQLANQGAGLAAVTGLGSEQTARDLSEYSKAVEQQEALTEGSELARNVASLAGNMAPTVLIPGAIALKAGQAAGAYAAAAVAAAQSTGGTYVSALEGYERQGVEKDTARLYAKGSAVAAGIITGLATFVGGKLPLGQSAEMPWRQAAGLGLAKALQDGGAKALIKEVFTKAAPVAAGRMAVAGASESIEEGLLDELPNSLLAMLTYAPEMTLKEAITQSAEAMQMATIFGGGMRGAGDTGAAIKEIVRPSELTKLRQFNRTADAARPRQDLDLAAALNAEATAPPAIDQQKSVGISEQLQAQGIDPETAAALAQATLIEADPTESTEAATQRATTIFQEAGGTISDAVADPAVYEQAGYSPEEAAQLAQQAAAAATAQSAQANAAVRQQLQSRRPPPVTAADVEVARAIATPAPELEQLDAQIEQLEKNGGELTNESELIALHKRRFELANTKPSPDHIRAAAEISAIARKRPNVNPALVRPAQDAFRAAIKIQQGLPVTASETQALLSVPVKNPLTGAAVPMATAGKDGVPQLTPDGRARLEQLVPSSVRILRQQQLPRPQAANLTQPIADPAQAAVPASAIPTKAPGGARSSEPTTASVTIRSPDGETRTEQIDVPAGVDPQAAATELLADNPAFEGWTVDKVSSPKPPKSRELEPENKETFARAAGQAEAIGVKFRDVAGKGAAKLPPSGLMAQADADGNVQIVVDSVRAAERLAGIADPAARQAALEDQLQEEQIHAADYLASKARWNGEGSFLDHYNAEKKAILSEVQAAIADLRARGEGKKAREIEQAIAGSINLYFRSAGDLTLHKNAATPEQILEKAIASPKAVAIVAELTRQLVQMRQSGGWTTETRFNALLDRLLQWAADLLPQLKRLADQADTVSPMLAQTIRSVEEVLNQADGATNKDSLIVPSAKDADEGAKPQKSAARPAVSKAGPKLELDAKDLSGILKDHALAQIGRNSRHDPIPAAAMHEGRDRHLAHLLAGGKVVAVTEAASSHGGIHQGSPVAPDARSISGWSRRGREFAQSYFDRKAEDLQAFVGITPEGAAPETDLGIALLKFREGVPQLDHEAIAPLIDWDEFLPKFDILLMTPKGSNLVSSLARLLNIDTSAATWRSTMRRLIKDRAADPQSQGTYKVLDAGSESLVFLDPETNNVIKFGKAERLKIGNGATFAVETDRGRAQKVPFKLSVKTLNLFETIDRGRYMWDLAQRGIMPAETIATTTMGDVITIQPALSGVGPVDQVHPPGTIDRDGNDISGKPNEVALAQWATENGAVKFNPPQRSGFPITEHAYLMRGESGKLYAVLDARSEDNMRFDPTGKVWLIDPIIHELTDAEAQDPAVQRRAARIPATDSQAAKDLASQLSSLTPRRIFDVKGGVSRFPDFKWQPIEQIVLGPINNGGPVAKTDPSRAQNALLMAVGGAGKLAPIHVSTGQDGKVMASGPFAEIVRIAKDAGWKALPTQAVPKKRSEELNQYAKDISPEADAAYLAAVEAGDMKAARMMVAKSAKASGFDIGPVWHGTSQKFSTFRLSKEGSESAIFFSDSKTEANQFPSMWGRTPIKPILAFLRGKIKVVEYSDNEGKLYDPDMMESILRTAREEGYDGVEVRGIQNFEGGEISNTWAVFTPSQVKSALTVTRDESGNVIPLSQRFNPEKDSILYAKDLSAARDSAEGRFKQELIRGGATIKEARRIAANAKDLAETWDNLAESLDAEADPRDVEFLRDFQDNWTKARQEAPGQKTIGNPERANPGSAQYQRDFVNGIDAAYDADFAPQSMKAWEAEADRRIEVDPESYRQKLLQTIEDKGIFEDPADVIAARKMVAKDIRRALVSSDPRDILKTAKMVWGYRMTGTQTARALAARRDVHKSKRERLTEFLINSILTPPPADRKKLENPDTLPGERDEILRKHTERLKKVESALAEMGVTFDDIVRGDVKLSLQAEQAMKSATTELALNDAQKTALKMIRKGHQFEHVAKETGLPIEQVRSLYDQVAAELRRKHFEKFKRGATIENLGAGAKDVSDEAAEREFQKALRMWLGAPEKGRTQTPFDITNEAHVVQLARLAAAAQGESSGIDMVKEFWINSILSGTATHAANVIGNAANAGLQLTFQRGAEAALNDGLKLAGRMMGKRWGVDRGATLSEFSELSLPVFTQAIRDGLTYATTAWKTENSIFKRQSLAESITLDEADDGKYGTGRVAIPGKTGKIVRIPGRTLLFADEFAKGVFGRLTVAMNAHRIVKAEEQARGEKYAKAEFRERVQRQVDTYGSPAWAMSVEQAEKVAFQQEIRSGKKGGTLGEQAVDAYQKIGSDSPGLMAAKVVVSPFVKTPFNIFRIGSQYTPLGLVGAAEQAIKSGMYHVKRGKTKREWVQAKAQEAGFTSAQAMAATDPRAVQKLADQFDAENPSASPIHSTELLERFAAQMLSVPLMLFLRGAAEGDGEDDDKKFMLLTGSRPPEGSGERGERDLTYRLGLGPTMISINPRAAGLNMDPLAISYGRIEPFATTFATIVDMMRVGKQAAKGRPTDEIPGAVQNYIMNQVQSKTFLAGISDLGQTFERPENLTKWAQRFATSFIPNIIRQPLRSFDDAIRDSRDATLAYQMFPIGIEGFAPPQRVDIWGQPLKKGGNPALRMAAINLAAQPEVKAADRALRNYKVANPADADFRLPQRPADRDISIGGQKVPLISQDRVELYRRIGEGQARAAKRFEQYGDSVAPTAQQMKRLSEDMENERSAARRRMAFYLRQRQPQGTK